jgi:Tol biopolymer transport system component
VVFESAATNLVAADTNNAIDSFRHDALTGAVERVSVADDGSEIGGDSIEPSVSASGQWVVFVAPDSAVSKLRGESTAASRLPKGNKHGVFLRNLVTESTQRVGTALPGGSGTRPVIAPQGDAIAFTGLPMNQGTPGVSTIFIVPLQRVGNELLPGQPFCLLCGSSGEMLSESPSRNPVLSADGRWLAFESEATDVLGLAESCPQASSQILLHDLHTGSTLSPSSPEGNAAVPREAAGHGGASPTIHGWTSPICWMT